MPTPTLARKAYRQETFSAPAFAIALEDLNLNGVDSANEGSSNLAADVENACDKSIQQRKRYRKHNEPVFCGTRI